MWVKSLSAAERYGGAGGNVAGRAAMKVLLVSTFLAVVLSVAFAGSVSAGLPAPSWMPNFPILAGNQAFLMWAPVPGAVKYKVYLENKPIGESTAFQFSTPAPEASGEYKFYVTGIDAAGTEGEKSKPGIIKIIAISPPKELLGRLSDDMKSVALRWGGTEGALLYNVYRSEKSGQMYNLLASVQDFNYRDSSVKEGKKYFYVVKAKDASGKESTASPQFSVEIPEPGKAVSLAAEKVITKIRVVKPLWEISAGLFGMLNGPIDIALDEAAGLLFVSNFGGKNVFVFDTKGEQVRTIEFKPEDPGHLLSPMGLDVNPVRRRVYVADSTAGNVKVYSYDGEYVEAIPVLQEHTAKYADAETRKLSETQKPNPRDVILSEDYSTVNVIDNPRSKVLQYSTQGKFLGEISLGIGKKGPGTFSFPIQGKVNRNKEHSGDLLVMDGFGTRVQVRDARTGKWRVFGEYGESAGEFKTPMDIDVDRNNNILATDKDNLVVTQFSYEGKFQCILGTDKGKFIGVGTPIGIAIDRAKDIVYLTDYYGGKVRAFQMTDQLIDRK